MQKFWLSAICNKINVLSTRQVLKNNVSLVFPVTHFLKYPHARRWLENLKSHLSSCTFKVFGSRHTVTVSWLRTTHYHTILFNCRVLKTKNVALTSYSVCTTRNLYSYALFAMSRTAGSADWLRAIAGILLFATTPMSWLWAPIDTGGKAVEAGSYRPVPLSRMYS